ncbi:MAG: hypothetical protein J0H12_03745 [Candidatus Paracaedimonas acanthamoebae]|uniref:Uncharacterized protein n=1 Tax=Candidatus Paracaedimonas acanthamoebae TaxID=244581 RepID=A0A8J7PM52_9PROT|nr:hypothetical protein [Candidatus Paracaedimonas acanthamoebae]
MTKERKLPLCIDLDGTLIRSDVTQESVLLFLRKYPWKILNIFIWLCKGRAFLKARLAAYVMIEPSLLPYNECFLEYIKDKAEKGHDLYLVTAADQKCAEIIHNYLGIFKEYLASDETNNLRAFAKAQALCLRFGSEKFIYAGNSRHDLPVWAKSAEIISVNTPQKILKNAENFHKKIHKFQDEPLKSKSILKDLGTYPWFRYYFFLYLLSMVGGYVFNKIKINHFDFYQYISFFIAISFSSIAAFLLGGLFNLEEIRRNPLTKETFLSTSRLTIVKVMYFIVIFTIIGFILEGFLSFFVFIFQFIMIAIKIKSKNRKIN